MEIQEKVQFGGRKIRNKETPEQAQAIGGRKMQKKTAGKSNDTEER